MMAEHSEHVCTWLSQMEGHGRTSRMKLEHTKGLKATRRQRLFKSSRAAALPLPLELSACTFAARRDKSALRNRFECSVAT